MKVKKESMMAETNASRTRQAAALGVVLKSPHSRTSGAAGPAPLAGGVPLVQAASAAAARRPMSWDACLKAHKECLKTAAFHQYVAECIMRHGVF